MLRDAHKGMEAMSMVAHAIKDERWGEAERLLQQLQEIITTLARQVGDKSRETLMAPTPDRGDRG
jgi:flagellin-specific chaperone FliS